MWTIRTFLVDESIEEYFKTTQSSTCPFCGEIHSLTKPTSKPYHNGEDVKIDGKSFDYLDSGDFYHIATRNCCKTGKIQIETRYNEGNHRVVLITFKHRKHSMDPKS